MANNPYVNKVVYGNSTLIDISDTTASAGDVAEGKYFYTANGARTLGTATEANYILTYDENTSVGAAQVGTATTGTQNYVPSGTVEHTTSNINNISGVSIVVAYYDYTKTLDINGISLTSESVPVVTSINRFIGDGVKFVIEKEETE